MQAPKNGFLQPRVIFISEKLVFGSLISDKALEQIQELVKLVKQDSLSVDKRTEQVQSLAKAAMRLSHASAVAIVTLNEVSSIEGLSVLSIIKAVMATESKQISLLVAEDKCSEWTNAIDCCAALKLLKKPVLLSKIEARDSYTKDDIIRISRRVLSTMEGFKLEGAHPDKYTTLLGFDRKGMSNLLSRVRLYSSFKLKPHLLKDDKSRIRE